MEKTIDGQDDSPLKKKKEEKPAEVKPEEGIVTDKGPINEPAEKKETGLPSSALNPTDLNKKEPEKSIINTEEKKEEKKETKLETGGTGVPASTLKEGAIDLAANTGTVKKNEPSSEEVAKNRKDITGGIFTKIENVKTVINEGKKVITNIDVSASKRLSDELLLEIEKSPVLNEQKNVTNNTTSNQTINSSVNNLVNDGTKNENKEEKSIVNKNMSIDLAQGGATTTDVSNNTNTTIDLAANTIVNKKTVADLLAEEEAAKKRKDLAGGIFTKSSNIQTSINEGKKMITGIKQSAGKMLSDELLGEIEKSDVVNDKKNTETQENINKNLEDQTRLDSENKKLPDEGGIDLANPNQQSQNIDVTKTAPSIPEEKAKEEIKTQISQNQQTGSGQTDLANANPQTSTTSQNQTNVSSGGQSEKRETVQPMPQNLNALENRLARIETILSGPLDVKIVT